MTPLQRAVVAGDNGTISILLEAEDSLRSGQEKRREVPDEFRHAFDEFRHALLLGRADILQTLLLSSVYSTEILRQVRLLLKAEERN